MLPWDDLFRGDSAEVFGSATARPIPPFVQPELHVERGVNRFADSRIKCSKSLRPTLRERSTAQPASIWTNWTSARALVGMVQRTKFVPVTRIKGFEPTFARGWRTPSRKRGEDSDDMTVTNAAIRVNGGRRRHSHWKKYHATDVAELSAAACFALRPEICATTSFATLNPAEQRVQYCAFRPSCFGSRSALGDAIDRGPAVHRDQAIDLCWLKDLDRLRTYHRLQCVSVEYFLIHRSGFGRHL